MSTNPLKVIQWSAKKWTLYDPAQARSLTQAETQLNGASVVVALSRRSSFVRQINVPDAPKSTVMQALRVTAGDHLPLPVNEIAFDVLMTPRTGLQGREVVLAAVKTDILETINEEIGKSRVSKILPLSFGSMLLAQSLGHPNAAVVDKDEEGYTVDIIENGELKYSRGLSPRVKESDLGQEVVRTFAAAGVTKSVVIAAGGIHVPNAEVSTSKTAVSALSEGASHLAIHLESFDAISKRHLQVKKSRNSLATLLGIAVAALGLVVYLDHSDKASAVAKKEGVWQKNFRKTKSIQTTVEQKANDTRTESQFLDQTFVPAQRLSEIMTVIANDTPQGVWLSGITIERGKPVILRGAALDEAQVAKFVQNLAARKRLRDTRLIFANQGTIDQKPVVQFSIQTIAIGNLPIATGDTSKGGSK